MPPPTTDAGSREPDGFGTTDPIARGSSTNLRPDSAAGAQTVVGDEDSLRQSSLPMFSQSNRLGRYMIVEKIAVGGMGVVSRAYDPKLDRFVAIKTLNPQRLYAGDVVLARKRLLREARTMASLEHPNIVTIHDTGFDADNDVVYLVMELLNGQTLDVWARQKSRRERLRVLLDVGRALGAAHAANVVHADFKPINVLVDEEDKPTVIDFGLATRVTDANARERAGTPAYMAPERLDALIAAKRSQSCEPPAPPAEQEQHEQERHQEQELAHQLTAPAPAAAAPDPANATVNLGSATTDVPGAAAEPAGEPAAPASASAEPAGEPADPASASAELAGEPAEPASASAEPAGEPAAPANASAEPASQPEGSASGARPARPGSASDRGAHQSDQFSFCVTLYEVLHGKNPFATDTIEGIRIHARAGLPDPPADHREPGWLRAIMRRGTATEPDDRYPSMTDLLDALEAGIERPQRLKRRATIATVAAVVIGLTAMVLAKEPPPPPCQGARERLAGVWDEDVKAGLRATFAAAGKAYLRDTSGLVEKSLDRYTDAWVAMHTEACEATHVRHEQSAGLLDLRMACLDRRIESFGALRGLLAEEADEKALRNAVQAVESLPGLERCEDREALTAAYPPPEDADVRARLDAARGRLDRAKAMYLAGQYRPGLELAQAIAIEAEEISYPPLEADALHLLGQLHAKIGDTRTAAATLRRALAAAATARDPNLRAKARITLTRVVGKDQRRYEDGMLLQSIAEEDVVYAGRKPLVQARLANITGNLYLAHGKYADARSHYERALAIREKQLGRDHFRTASPVNNLAAVAFAQHEHEKAEALYRRALLVLDESLGAEHPSVARTLNNLAGVLLELGKHSEAISSFERALAISERVFGTDHPQSAAVLSNLGDLHANLRQHEKARIHYRRAVVIFEDRLGPTSPMVAHPLTGLGKSLIADNRASHAIPLLERAVNIRVGGEKNSPLVADSCFALSRALRAERRDPERARDLAEKALELYEVEGKSNVAEAADVRKWLAGAGSRVQRVNKH